MVSSSPKAQARTPLIATFVAAVVVKLRVKSGFDGAEGAEPEH
jgi:hypothetical protein